MKVYIPFNSNDFNSIFTTLSISPNSFYPIRNYSFKRSTSNFLINNNDFLVGFLKPVFHNKKFDKEEGYPVLLEIEINNEEIEINITDNNLAYVIIDSTIFLYNNFKLFFRNSNELNETIAKSFKSIETKFLNLAKKNAYIIEEECFIDKLPIINFPTINHNINCEYFEKERKLNRILGVIIGSSIYYSSIISQEWNDISLLFRDLNNNLSLYLNNIGSNIEFERGKILSIIDDIATIYESIQSLDESIFLKSTLSPELYYNLKESKIFNISTIDLLIDGLLIRSNIELSFPLKLEKLKRAIKAKFNAKYPSNYIEKINNILVDIKIQIDNDINILKKDNILNEDKLIKFSFQGNKESFYISKSLPNKEILYLEKTLCYFVNNDKISDVDTFFINRKNILIDLANYFKSEIHGFDKSEERNYLIKLLSSFDNLRSPFDISGTKNDVLKSLAILFTTGRDLLRFIENNEKEKIQNSIIYYSIWGSIYGASFFPKTLTVDVTANFINVDILLSAFKNARLDFITSNISKHLLDLKDNEIEEFVDDNFISIEAQKILEIVNSKNKIKVSDIKKILKKYKTNKEIEELVLTELVNKVLIVKEERTSFLEKIN